MSSLNARTRHAEPVYLNIYDLSPMNDYIYDIGFGFYHSGVQVHGDEWTFSTSGVFYHRPQQAPNVKFRTQVLLGTVNYTSSKVKDIINSLRDDFQGERYHLLNNNCNCFSERISMELLGKPIPGYVNRLANIGSSVSCLIPKSLLGDSPVNESSSSSSGGGYRRINNRNSGISMAPLGAGMTLGGGSNNNNNNKNSSNNNAADLRAKRLARFQNNNNHSIDNTSMNSE